MFLFDHTTLVDWVNANGRGKTSTTERNILVLQLETELIIPQTTPDYGRYLKMHWKLSQT